MATTDPIRDKELIKKLFGYFLLRAQTRNYLLVNLGVYTALRISDLLRLAWDDVYDFENRQFRQSVYIIEKKTQKPKIFALNKEAIKALKYHARASGKCEPGRFLFESNRTSRKAISRIQAYRIIRQAAAAVGIQGVIGCHSMRKTFGYHAWKGGAPIAVIMDVFNHSSPAITRRYLGVSQDDRDQVYMRLSFG